MHDDIPAAALACTHRPTSMYADPRAQPPSMNALPANQRTLCTASHAIDATHRRDRSNSLQMIQRTSPECSKKTLRWFPGRRALYLSRS